MLGNEYNRELSASRNSVRKNAQDLERFFSLFLEGDAA